MKKRTERQQINDLKRQLRDETARANSNYRNFESERSLRHQFAGERNHAQGEYTRVSTQLNYANDKIAQLTTELTVEKSLVGELRDCNVRQSQTIADRDNLVRQLTARLDALDDDFRIARSKANVREDRFTTIIRLLGDSLSAERSPQVIPPAPGDESTERVIDTDDHR